ncbi:CIA30 family protein [Psychrobium sp. MM17-31]|uniref:CIA30 family protein n=1 Tax=Psychrobium sp. MM17-31 TaxID=2917758 RepID=UPI001EF3FFD6|nr:CIA30 family protein [Psychrobium sp. MM17-31]MCG7532503.1 CIA30 family protein [Psychrobium sp. MM17-31]
MTQLKTLFALLSMSLSVAVIAKPMPQEQSLLIDNFDNQQQTSVGSDRLFISDAAAGGGTKSNYEIKDGVIHLAGDIAPPRGQPGWSSMVLPLAEMGKGYDASNFSGVRLTVKVNKGNFSLSANSTEVTNFDYHAAPIVVKADGNFHTIEIPFDSMKRAWSAQTTLNKKTINSLSIVAFGLQKSAFDFDIDEVSFY